MRFRGMQNRATLDTHRFFFFFLSFSSSASSITTICSISSSSKSSMSESFEDDESSKIHGDTGGGFCSGARQWRRNLGAGETGHLLDGAPNYAQDPWWSCLPHFHRGLYLVEMLAATFHRVWNVIGVGGEAWRPAKLGRGDRNPRRNAATAEEQGGGKMTCPLCGLNVPPLQGLLRNRGHRRVDRKTLVCAG
jgi:hypothetical protein